MEAAEYATLYRTETRHWWYRGLHRLVRQHFDRYAGRNRGVMLDVGCGTGAVLSQLQSQMQAALGIDIAGDAIRFCRRRGLVCTAQATATALPAADAAVDLVTALDVLYHRAVPDEVVVLREVARVLKPGGVFMLNLPAYQWLYSSHDTAVHTRRRYTRGEVLALLRGAGLEPVAASYWNSLLLPLSILVRLWRKRFPQPGSDLAVEPPRWQNLVFGAALGLERFWLRYANLPCGLSIFAVARKPAG